MLRKTIKNLNQFTAEEKKILLRLVESVYFYWYKFEILKDSVDVVKAFNKPKPFTYMAPLSDYPRLQNTMGFNASMVSFLNATPFFEKVKKKKSDRFLLHYLKECKTHSELLYKLSLILHEKQGMPITYSKNRFKEFIDELIIELEEEIEKEYVKTVKKFRNQILAHHTNINVEEFVDEIADNLMMVVKFLEEFLLIKVSHTITQVYNAIDKPLNEDIHSLRKKLKPNLMTIQHGEIIFKVGSEEVKGKILNDPLFLKMIGLFDDHSITLTGDDIYVIYIITNSAYDQSEKKPMIDRGQGAIAFEIIDKYKLNNSNIKETILDH